MREKEREKDLERVVLSRSLPEAPLSFNLCEVHRTAQLEGWKVGHYQPQLLLPENFLEPLPD